MKKNILSLAALLIASATFVACSNDNNIIDENQQPVNPTGKYTMTINASKGGASRDQSRAGSGFGEAQPALDEVKGGDGATTRALSLDGTTLNATWATTENVYVKKGVTWATGSLQPDADGITATLKGTLSDITIEADDELTLQLPRSGAPDYTGQKGTLADIAAKYDYATATVTVESVSPTGNINPTEATTTFENQQAIVKFTLKNKTDDSNLSAKQLTVSDGTNDYTVTPAKAGSEIYVAIPCFSGQTVTLTATVGDDTYTYEKTGVTFDNSKYYAITVKMTKVTDLSMVKCDGTARASRWTANCYMVHTAGYYKLPLVYGNAIKNGTTNKAAYTGVTSGYYNDNPDEPVTTETFPRHDGNAITAPWIKDNRITVASAELLWQDATGLITAVDIDGNYLTLTVGKDAATQEGNAVIAAKDGEGNIVWSWHIWVTKQTFANLTTVHTGSHNYQVTPVNLGWVATSGDGKQGYNTFYQWGRKDAFIPSNGAIFPDPYANHTVYDISGTAVTGFTFEASTTATIADNIKNPTTHYYNSSNESPCTTTYYNMWDAQQTRGNNIATATVKTVYDPCPAGFCVPTDNLYYYIGDGLERKMKTWDPSNYGATWSNSVVSGSITGNDLYFPASGCRIFSKGSLDEVCEHGYCWSASADDDNVYYARYFYFDWSLWNSGEDFRASGLPVRAVAEE